MNLNQRMLNLFQRVNKQIETKTKDGRRRITPIFIESQPLIGYD